ncbi:choice-of-anchor A family protein [Bifidobacterium adolescentis]|nr:choice-of-anchor A family protein [Bifidobacterium adolescentis]KAB6058442.1 choice-of-anchor A family protein [Bifidobacterium adolescentis]KAB6072242.1 choice-of-anchor A family protein [Bifidobacterium adolescentis]
MSKWPKKPLLAVLAALTAVGLGVPCAMADGTAAATAYITVAAVGGTTLDGRTYKAYRLGSYGRADVRVDPDSGDRYAASIPVSTDPDRADAVADAGSKAGFTGDDMLAAAWASTDSAKLEAFARGLASSLSDAEPAASVEGAGRMGPFTPGVYLVSGSDGSACLTGTLPSEGVGDRSHVLGIAEFEGDAQAAAAPQANSDESLATLDDDGDTSGSPIARYAAPTTVYHRLFDGTVTSTALDNEDPAISIYTGGNMDYMNGLEIEGSVIVNGNLTHGRGLVAGRANWGMGYTPPKNSVMLAVGGDYSSVSTTNGNNWDRGAVGGKAQIGGRDNRVIPLDSTNTINAYGFWGTWYIPGQTNVKSTSNMGHDAALKVDIDGKGTIVDYNDYVDRQLQPLSTQLANETPTGKVGYARGTDSTETVWLGVNGRNDDGSMKYNGQKDTVTVTGDEGVITFTGDGKKHTQVFDLDMDELESQRKALKLLQWGVDFENVPGDTAIVVNVRGSGSRTWNTGWRYWVNGRKVSIGVNQQDGTYNDFRKLASRVLWNWTDASYVKYDESHGIMHINSTHSKAQDGKESYEGGSYGSAASPGKASNLPGTVLAPKANVRMRCDQNGRLLVGKDLTLDVWEHHNNPWVGFVDDNSVTVDAATTASHDGVDVGTTKAVHDSISLRDNGKKYGAAAAKATVTLNYSASSNGKTADKKDSKATGAIQVPAGKTVSTDSPDFTPADLGMKSWQPGRYWFDLSVEEKDLSVTGTARYETSDVGNVAGLSGLTDSSEQWTITPTSAPTISTRAMAGDAKVGGTQKVHDSITIANPDPNRAITVAKVTTTLHMRTGNRKASKTVGPVTIPAGGSKTFDSADFVPSDLKRKGWSAKTDYWFDATVAAADATYPSGAQALSADLIHDGEKDKAQHFALTFSGGPGDFSTQAQGTFSTAGGTSIVHDRLVVTTGADSLADDLSVRVTLNWASSPTATRAEASATKADVVPAGSDHKDLRDFAPSDLKMPAWKAGRYWYDVDIPAQDGVDDAITLHGLTKDTARESWTAVTPFGLDLAKLAYIGQPGQGRWSNEPVKGAAFTLTETTDQTGSTAKPGTAVKTVTTDANGSAHLLDGTILPSEVRWFKLVETKAPSSYEAPAAGSYWMIRATGTPDGATISVTGSNEEAKALLKGSTDSTVTVGDQLEGNIMPPLTGGRYDVARAGALAGVVTLGLLIAGCAVLRRRNTSPLDR